jgi:hypothetical protein
MMRIPTTTGSAMVLGLALLGVTLVTPAQQPCSDGEHTRWVTDSLMAMQTIKPGMTRQDLAEVFTTEGGLSNRKHRQYVYRHCPYIKVLVEFEPVGDVGNLLTESPQDKILSISKPYLEWTNAD